MWRKLTKGQQRDRYSFGLLTERCILSKRWQALVVSFPAVSGCVKYKSPPRF
jgi:hypothetical protein